ncbi:MAG: helix-turn-helix domain-containing protein [Pseudomonadota bacterium]
MSIAAISVRSIGETVAIRTGITWRLQRSLRRPKDVSTARMVTMYLACELTEHSLPMIGEVLNRDHTTIIYGRDQIEDRMVSDPDLRSLVSNCRTDLEKQRVATAAAALQAAGEGWPRDPETIGMITEIRERQKELSELQAGTRALVGQLQKNCERTDEIIADIRIEVTALRERLSSVDQSSRRSQRRLDHIYGAAPAARTQTRRETSHA